MLELMFNNSASLVHHVRWKCQMNKCFLVLVSPYLSRRVRCSFVHAQWSDFKDLFHDCASGNCSPDRSTHNFIVHLPEWYSSHSSACTWQHVSVHRFWHWAGANMIRLLAWRYLCNEGCAFCYCRRITQECRQDLCPDITLLLANLLITDFIVNIWGKSKYLSCVQAFCLEYVTCCTVFVMIYVPTLFQGNSRRL